MKYFYSLLITLILAGGINAQDTLLWQNFEEDILNMLLYPDLDSIGSDNWINWDEDEIPDANNRAQNWAFYLDYYIASLDSIPPADTNTVFGSSSWLQDFLPGNKNWLITPPLLIGDDQAMLHFKSAPFQAPRYMDGYSVLISTEDYFPSSFTDTIFRHKQMTEPLPAGASDNDQNALNVDSFVFAPATFLNYEQVTEDAYIHDNKLTGSYTSQDTADTFYRGILEPHSYSLAKYSGQTIYIAFLHDSDDDNLISIDDILVTGNYFSSVKNSELDLRYSLYPNPASHLVNVSYRFKEKVPEVSLVVYNVLGEKVVEVKNLDTSSGEHQQSINVAELTSGQYTIVLSVGNKQVSKNFVKK